MMQIYVARIDAFLEEALFIRACREIDDFRLEKVNACRGAENGARSLCCGLMLQYYMRRYIGTERKAELRYACGSAGKPYLEGFPRLHFSLSHSAGYVAAVFAGRAVGIDIQGQRPLKEGVVRRVLSQREYGRYERLTAQEERRDWFFRCWCAKESYVKLTGEGMARDFRSLCLEAEGGRIVPERASGTEAICREYRPAPGYYMNVCTAWTAEEAAFPEQAVDVTAKLIGMLGSE